MNKKWLGAGLAFLLGGCASVEMAQYMVTSFAEVPLEKQAKVKFVANSDAISTVVDTLKSEFSKESGFRVVEEDADYWFVLNGADQYANGAPQKVFSVAKMDNGATGSEVVEETAMNLASATKSVSVAVYDARSLAPVRYFEIPIYAGAMTKDAVRDANGYEQDFAKEVIERVKDAFITQEKKVETPISCAGDATLRDLFKKAGESADIEKSYADVSKAICQKYAEFVRRYKLVHGKIDLAKLLSVIRSKEYDGKVSADEVLSDYQMYLLISEFNATRKGDVASLRKIRDQHLMILENSEEKGLVEAIPVALARLEYKLANLGE